MKKVVLIEKLTTVIPNKYEAVRVIAKEARRINSLLIRSNQGEIDEKPTMMALRRLLEHKVKYQFVEPDELPDLEADDDDE
jgi:DNA-directed RNA polymerase omega subunit